VIRAPVAVDERRRSKCTAGRHFTQNVADAERSIRRLDSSVGSSPVRSPGPNARQRPACREPAADITLARADLLQPDAPAEKSTGISVGLGLPGLD
jgi:hypothetical protein